MKVFIVFASFVAVASASHLYGAGPLVSGPIESGSSSQFRSEDDHGNYQFGYDESHASGGSSRREEESNGVRRGSYSLSDADGRRRTVNYFADASGFHAEILTNEPGVESKDPADVLINKNGHNVVAPILAAPAPILAAPAPIFAAQIKGYAAPAPLPVPAPIFAAQTKGYAGPAPLPAPLLAAPVHTYAAGPAYQVAAPIEAPTPRAFSYSFGSTHTAPVGRAYLAPAPVYSAPAPGPIFQQRLAY